MTTSQTLTLILFVLCFASQAECADPLPSLTVARQRSMAIPRPDGRIYILGGYRTASGDLNSLELYDPDSGSQGSMRAPYHDSVISRSFLLGNGLLVVCASSCDTYDPSTNQWSARPLLGIPVSDYAPVALLQDGSLLRVGGTSISFQLTSGTNEAYIIDPNTFTLRAVGKLNVARAYASLFRLLDGRLLAAGGVDGGPLNSAEIFEPATEQWQRVGDMLGLNGPFAGALLPSGRVLGCQSGSCATFDPSTRAWQALSSARLGGFGALTLLPDGRIVATGGSDSLDGNSNFRSTTLFLDPNTGSVSPGPNLRTPRDRHAVAVLPDGRVFLVGGVGADGQATNSVERFAWQPSIRGTFEAGYYVVAAEQKSRSDDGFWGIEVHSSGALDGGLNFGGLLAAGGQEVGFGAFYISDAQTVTGTVATQVLPGASGAVDLTLQILDVNKNPVAAAVRGLGSLNWSQLLQPGFYVLELRSGSAAPAASFQMAVAAPHLQAGGSVGSSLKWSAGVVGFAGFYLANKQDVAISLYNEQSYGYGRGAGNVILTLYDWSGKVLQRIGPGVTPP